MRATKDPAGVIAASVICTLLILQKIKSKPEQASEEQDQNEFRNTAYKVPWI